MDGGVAAPSKAVPILLRRLPPETVTAACLAAMNLGRQAGLCPGRGLPAGYICHTCRMRPKAVEGAEALISAWRLNPTQLATDDVRLVDLLKFCASRIWTTPCLTLPRKLLEADLRDHAVLREIASATSQLLQLLHLDVDVRSCTTGMT